MKLGDRFIWNHYFFEVEFKCSQAHFHGGIQQRYRSFRLRSTYSQVVLSVARPELLVPPPVQSVHPNWEKLEN
jgi:hypothetical protein